MFATLSDSKGIKSGKMPIYSSIGPLSEFLSDYAICMQEKATNADLLK